MTKDKSLILAADDLHVAQHVAIHSWRNGRCHWLGDALEIKAACLPYLVVKFVSQQDWPSVTLDTRQVNLMQVSPEFVAAQLGGYPADLCKMEPSPQAEQPHDG